jgi:uncharacterized protein YndB with AHSA1/START domain
MTATASTKPTAEREVTITRLIDAPRALVFKMWTDPKHLAQWWGPKGFTNPICEIDVRPGGAIRIVMRASDEIAAQIGRDHPMTGTFHEIIVPERIVFTAVAEDHEGRALLRSFTTVSFADQGGKTKLTIHAKAVGLAPIAPQMLAGMEAGWTQSLERLDDLARDSTTPKSKQGV